MFLILSYRVMFGHAGTFETQISQVYLNFEQIFFNNFLIFFISTLVLKLHFLFKTTSIVKTSFLYPIEKTPMEKKNKKTKNISV